MKIKAVLWVVFGVFARLVPHVPSMTPMTSLSLFAGSQLSKRFALLTVFGAMLVSDVLLAYLQGHPIFSRWSLFTYSGFVLITLFGSKRANKFSKLPLYLLGSSMFFWAWTNFGVWLTSNLYTKTLQGLIICYTAALPFLRSEIIGSLLWGLVIFGGFMIVNNIERLFARSKTL